MFRRFFRQKFSWNKPKMDYFDS